MISRCQQTFAETNNPVEVEFRCEDIRSTDLSHASVIILNFTLQFLPLEDRDALLRRIQQALLPGGVLILSEKIHFPDAHQESMLYELHHEFKRANGYSDMEISQKRTALENTLITETLEDHRERAKSSGFRSCDAWFQCFNFASMIALK